MGRQTMRNYTGLIDSLIAYVQNCVAASRCDDKVSVAPSDPLPSSCTAPAWSLILDLLSELCS